MALKELIFYSFYFVMEECGGLERTDFYIYIIDSMD